MLFAHKATLRTELAMVQAPFFSAGVQGEGSGVFLLCAISGQWVLEVLLLSKTVRQVKDGSFIDQPLHSLNRKP